MGLPIEQDSGQKVRRQRGHAECDRGEKILSSQEGNPECHNYASSGEVSSGLPYQRL